MTYNIIEVAFGTFRKVTSIPINYKFDIGQILRITGLTLPENYVVDFCNDGDSTTISMVGTADGVRIPDEFLQTGKPVKAYVVLSGAGNTQTRYEITIPVNARPERTDIQPTPEEQSTIDSLVSAMNTAVEDSGENADRAESEADRAATEADRAEQAAESIGDKVERAEAAAQAAGVSATRAEDAAEDAEGYRDEAEQSAGSATSSAEDARNSKETAIEKAAEAEQSAAQAAASAASIEGDVAEAEQAAQTATQAATNAEDAKDAANLFARNAAESAEAAHLSEVSAEDSASTATAKAAEASASATAAQTAQTGAETAQTAAEAAQQAAEEAAQQAETILVDKAPVITDTASGAIASFPDGAENLPLKSLVASIEPVQSGTGDPSPDNVRPISGWTGAEIQGTGKNLLPNKKYQDTSIRVQLGQDSADYFLMKAGTYKLSYGLTSGITAGAYWRVRGGAVQNSTDIVLAEDSEIQIWLYKNPLSADDVLWWQLERGSAATAYEPYQGSALSINWQDEAGTVYGGTLDVVTGELTVASADADMGELSWAKGNRNNDDTGNIFYIRNTPYKNLCELQSSILKSLSPQAVFMWEAMPVNSCMSAAGGYFVICMDYDTVADLKAVVSGQQIIFELATPQTYQLTPQEVDTLLGTNNIWVDTGDVSAEYRADTKLYLEKLTAPTEDDLIADHAITSGSFFMIGNTLYKATAAIANGATITPGTNATRLSLADALNLLS